MPKLNIFIVLFLLPSIASAVDQITNVTVGSTQETIQFINGYNLDKCLEFDKFRKKIERVDDKTCNGLRDFHEKKLAKDEERQRLANEAQERQKQAVQEREQAQIKLEQQRKEAEEKYQANRAIAEAQRQKAEEEQQKEDEAYERQQIAASKKQNEKTAALKAKCGEDYKNPQIGMSLLRVKECVAPVKLVSQINRVDGVASLYQYGSLWLNVMEGHVIAWGR